MRAEIDITEDDSAYPFGDGSMPEPSIITDDDSIVLRLADVSIRMTYSQFDGIVEKMNEWRNSIPADSSCQL